MKLYAEAGRMVWCSLDLPQTNTPARHQGVSNGLGEPESAAFVRFPTVLLKRKKAESEAQRGKPTDTGTLESESRDAIV